MISETRATWLRGTGRVIEVIGRLSMAVSAEEEPPARMLHLYCLKRHTIVVCLCTRPVDLTVCGIIIVFPL